MRSNRPVITERANAHKVFRRREYEDFTAFTLIVLNFPECS